MSVMPTVVSENLRITYGLASSSRVRIVLYDVAGRMIESIRDIRQNVGRHTVNKNLSRIPSGVYFVRFEAENRLETKKVVISR